MRLRDALEHAARGYRDDLRLHLLATLSLTVAFMCLGFALLGVANLIRLEEHWAGDRRLTVYLDDVAGDDAIAQLRLVLGSLEEVSDVAYISPKAARASFTADSDFMRFADVLPPDAFPASLELTLAGATSEARIRELARRVASLHAVAEVDTYAAWFSRLKQLLTLGRWLTLALALLVALCVVAVIANSIRLSLGARLPEIEIMRYCGATETFVRTPFVLEGAMQGGVAASIALVALSGCYAALHGELKALASTVLGMSPTFLGPISCLALLGLGLAGGGLGSAWTLYRLDPSGEA